MAKIPVTQIDDGALRSNPYLALQQSGQIRPGEGASKADQSFAQMGDALSNATKLADAKFASEDKTAINTRSTAFDKLMAETKRSVAEGNPASAEVAFKGVINGYKESIMADESLSAIARERTLAYIEKASISQVSAVSASAGVKLGKIEVAELESWSNSQIDIAVDDIRNGDALTGTTAYATYLENMEGGLDKFYASVGTAFVSKEQAKTVYEAQVSQGFSQIVSSMVAADDPIYGSQIDEILSNPKFRIDNYAQLQGLRNSQKLTHAGEEVASQVSSINIALNAASEAIAPTDVAYAKSVGLPMHARFVASLEDAHYAGESNDKISSGKVSSSGLIALDNYFANNAEFMSIKEIDAAFADIKKSPMFANQAIVWDDKLKAAKDFKVQKTNELSVTAHNALKDSANSIAPLTDATIAETISTVFEGNQLVSKTGGVYTVEDSNSAALSVLVPLLKDLSSFEHIGDDQYNNFKVVEGYIKNTLRKGNDILDISTRAAGRQTTLGVFEAEAGVFMTELAVDGGTNRVLSKPAKGVVNKQITEMLSQDATRQTGMDYLGMLADNGDILDSHRELLKGHLDAKNYGEVFDLVETWSEKNKAQVNELFDSSVYDSLKDNDSLGTLANALRSGSDVSKTAFLARLNNDENSLGGISKHSESVGKIVKGEFNNDTHPHYASAESIRSTLNELLGKPTGGLWTDDERSEYAHVVGTLLYDRNGTEGFLGEDLKTYIEGDEFKQGFLQAVNGNVITFANFGESNALSYNVFPKGYPQARIQNIADDAALNTLDLKPWNGSPHTSFARNIGLPSWFLGANDDVATYGGWIGQAAEKVLGDDQTGDTLIDMGNAFLIEKSNASSLTKDFQQGDLLTVPYKRGGMVAGYLIFDVTDDGISPARGIAGADMFGVVANEHGEFAVQLMKELGIAQSDLSENRDTTFRSGRVTEQSLMNVMLNQMQTGITP
jgi:hypothetical protein